MIPFNCDETIYFIIHSYTRNKDVDFFLQSFVYVVMGNMILFVC